MASKYKNNEFSDSFKENVRFEIATQNVLNKECSGTDWENIVAYGMKANRIRSNTGLSDIYNADTAWSAKTIGDKSVGRVKKVELISGRMDPTVMMDGFDDYRNHPVDIGHNVIGLWNSRVCEAREKFNDIRTIVLVRNKGQTSVMFYEEMTETYDPDSYNWVFHGSVLHGYNKSNGMRKFAWQTSGGQFRIVSQVPKEKVTLIIPALKPLSRSEQVEFMTARGYKPGVFTNIRQMEFVL